MIVTDKKLFIRFLKENMEVKNKFKWIVYN